MRAVEVQGLTARYAKDGPEILRGIDFHVDENDFYGGAEAAFSLQEAEEWAQRMKDGKQR